VESEIGEGSRFYFTLKRIGHSAENVKAEAESAS